MRNVETVGKVTRTFELRTFKTETREGKVASLVIGDETGTIRVTMWGDQADNIQKVKEGIIVKVKGAYARDNNGRVEVHMNDQSQLIVSPAGEEVGEVKTTPTSTRKKIQDLSLEEDNVA